MSGELLGPTDQLALDRYARAFSKGPDGRLELVGHLMIQAGLDMVANLDPEERADPNGQAAASVVISHGLSVLTDQQIGEVVEQLSDGLIECRDGSRRPGTHLLMDALLPGTEDSLSTEWADPIDPTSTQILEDEEQLRRSGLIRILKPQANSAERTVGGAQLHEYMLMRHPELLGTAVDDAPPSDSLPDH